MKIITNIISTALILLLAMTYRGNAADTLVSGLQVQGAAALGPTTVHGDVELQTWNPQITLTATNEPGGAFAMTGTWYYALAASNSVLGVSTSGPAVSVTVATGDLVRVTWYPDPKANAYLLYRGATAVTLTNYAALGITTSFTDSGTNTWLSGQPAPTVQTPRILLADGPPVDVIPENLRVVSNALDAVQTSLLSVSNDLDSAEAAVALKLNIADYATNVLTYGGSFYDVYYTLSTQAVWRGVVLGSTTSTNADQVLTHTQRDPAVSDYQLYADNYRDVNGVGITWASATPGVATVDTNGFVTQVSTGSVSVTATVGTYSQSVSLVMSSINGWTNTLITGGEPLSFREEVSADLDAQVSSDIELFDTVNHSTTSYVRNASCWAYAAATNLAAWGAVAVYNSTSDSTRRGATLITEDVVLGAAHYFPGAGATLRFLSADGSVITRTLTSRHNVGGDVVIGLLDSAIDPADVLPALIYNYDSTRAPTGLEKMPIVSFNQDRHAAVREVLGDSVYLSHGYPIVGDRPDAGQYLRGGDSGQPNVLLYEDRLIVLGCHHTATGSPLVSPSQLNNAISAAGGSSTVTATDLSGYKNYGPPGP